MTDAERIAAVVAAVLADGATAQLDVVLGWYDGACRGVSRPASAPRPVMTSELRAVRSAVRELAAAQAAAAVADAREMSVAHAAGLLQVTEGRVRQRLLDGTLRGRKVAGVWLVDLTSIEERANGEHAASRRRERDHAVG